MKALEMKQHMQSVGSWVDWEHTCDRFITGDPEAEVTGIAVAWQARSEALKQAVDMGCNLFITHEPVFYRHMDDDLNLFNQPHIAAKKKYIEDKGLVIFRCHDVWDRMPDVGIVDSWAHYLGLSHEIAADPFHSVYPAPAATLEELAEYVAAKVKDLGQDCVEMVGDPDAKVSKAAIGCGAITQYETMVNLGADVIIGTDDGMSYWGGGAWALDRGIPLIIVNHATAEEPGMQNLADYIDRHFCDVKTVYIPQGSMFRTVV